MFFWGGDKCPSAPFLQTGSIDRILILLSKLWPSLLCKHRSSICHICYILFFWGRFLIYQSLACTCYELRRTLSLLPTGMCTIPRWWSALDWTQFLCMLSKYSRLLMLGKQLSCMVSPKVMVSYVCWWPNHYQRGNVYIFLPSLLTILKSGYWCFFSSGFSFGPSIIEAILTNICTVWKVLSICDSQYRVNTSRVWWL